MIKLHSFGAGNGIADLSPFCLKIDAYLRMSGLEFEALPGVDNLRKAPKGKLPFIDDDGQIIADSHFIIQHLQKKYGAPLEDWLTEEQKAAAHLAIKSIDDSFYWSIVYSRWAKDDSWPGVKEAYFGSMPFPLKHIVPFIARRGILNLLKKQGLARHSEEEILELTRYSLEALSRLIGSKPFFFGDKPSSLDAVAYGFVSQLILAPFDNSFNQLARSYPNLVRFCEHVRESYYS